MKKEPSAKAVYYALGIFVVIVVIIFFNYSPKITQFEDKGECKVSPAHPDVIEAQEGQYVIPNGEYDGRVTNPESMSSSDFLKAAYEICSGLSAKQCEKNKLCSKTLKGAYSNPNSLYGWGGNFCCIGIKGWNPLSYISNPIDTECKMEHWQSPNECTPARGCKWLCPSGDPLTQNLPQATPEPKPPIGPQPDTMKE